MLEIKKNFFKNCRTINKKTGKNFFLIKDWEPRNAKRQDERDYHIKLSFHIFGTKEQFLLNRHRKGNSKPDRGVELPIAITPYVGKLMINQITGKAYEKGSCDPANIQFFGEYTFELIKGFPFRNSRAAINFKLMYNNKETTYFLNREVGAGKNSNQAGVEIPKELLEQIARYLIQCSKLAKKN